MTDYDAHNARAASYGVRQTNPMTQEVADIREAIDHGNPVELTDPDLKTIVRLRLLTDRDFPFWDVSYCYGQLDDGTYVLVNLPWDRIPKQGGLKLNLVKMCQQVKVYGKGIGILDAISTMD